MADKKPLVYNPSTGRSKEAAQTDVLLAGGVKNATGDVTLTDQVGALTLDTIRQGLGGGIGGGHTIQDEGVSLTQRSKLDFIGPGVSVVDNAISGATEVHINATGTGGVGSGVNLDLGSFSTPDPGILLDGGAF